MPPRKQEPPVLTDAAEKTDMNGKLLKGAEAASAETVTAERQQPGTRRKRSANTTTDAQPTETSGTAAKPRASRRKSAAGATALISGADADATAKPRTSKRKSAAGATAPTSDADADAAAKPRTSRRKGAAGIQPAEPQPQEAPEAAPQAEEEALTVTAPSEPAAESPSSADTAEVKSAATDTAEDAAPVLQLLETRLKKKERSETHDKDRVFIRKDLKLRLDALAENRGKGFKTLLLNYGLEKALDELEQAEAARQED
ncbi:hypothetical protein [Paenibacillus oleatilyticus]|uniref:hypothetical protein n=1 Tax=Paenibacillus oleatilyticus TaxID=2594886 RepID=UPI001C1F729E|nr:hypothetical protein [Paenibacillus oleatilyticus]MBU7317837.1 hypothetical protein [Paenibacillus oleatilyticus]